MSDRGIEVNSFIKRISLIIGLGAVRESTLGHSFTSSTVATASPLVLIDVLLMHPLELCNKMADHSVVKVFST